MIDHNVPKMNLVELDEGEIALPGEQGITTFPATLRKFILLTRRAYNQNALEALSDIDGIKVSKYTADDYSVFSSTNDNTAKDYFGITLKFSPIGDFDTFVEEDGDNFFNSLLHTVSFSAKRKLRGTRAAFIREFRLENDPSLGAVLVSKILISTSIFYNDYRVTTGYPFNSNELDEATEEIFNKINASWGTKLKLSLENEFI